LASFGKVWPGFDVDHGLIDINEFKRVMIQVAQDQGLYEGDAQ
jgi:hypothetical protein